ncbi:MAG: hypothetical protein ACI4AD_03785 [Roseburia sp.]
MSIRPVEFNGMIQRTQDVSNMKQAEDNRPVVEQHNIQVQQQKQEDRLAHQVQDPEEKENTGYRYDAKEKGNNSYQGSGGKERRKKKEDTVKDGKVIFKGQRGNFDIKI